MTDFTEVKSLIEKQGEAWNEYQKTNDERLEKMEKGLSTSDLDQKLELINTDLDSIRKSFDDLEKKAGRPDADAQLSEDQAEYKKAFGTFIRTGEGNPSDLKALGRKAMNSSSDPDGGFFVLPEMDTAIDRIAPTISAMARIADTVTIGSAKWQKMMKTSGMAMRRVADGSGGGETDTPNFAKVEIEVHTAEVEPWVYNETLEDSFVDLEMDLAEEAAIGFAEGGASEFISGDGVGGARGITSYSNVANSAYTWGTVGYIASGAAGAFASSNPADKVVDLQHALKSQYRPEASFLTNDATLGIMRQFKDASGSYYLWNPDPSAGFGGRFLGSPVEIDDNMAVVAAGSFSLAYGNFKRAYKIVNRSGTTLLRDPYTTKGQTKFNFTRRFGGGIYNYEAIKLMKFATS